MKQSISRCLDILADDVYQGEPLDESDRCRIGMIVCKAIKREVDVNWHSEHGQAMAGPGDIIAALYHWAHDHSGGQWSETYALGCAAGAIYDPNGNSLEPDSMEAMLYLEWTYTGALELLCVCTDCHNHAHLDDSTWIDGVYDANSAAGVQEYLEAAFKPHEGKTMEWEGLLDQDHSTDACELCGDPDHGERKGMVMS